MLTLAFQLPRKVLGLGRRCPGLYPLMRRMNANSVAIVMYHGIVPRPLPVFNWCQLAVAEFARQIEFLSRHYLVLPLREVVQRMANGKPLPKNAAVVTFDDGFRNVLTGAFPVLRRHDVPATVFLVTGLVGTDQPAWPERLYHAVATTSRMEVCLSGKRWTLTTAVERSTAYRSLAARLKHLPTVRKDAQLVALHEQLGVAATVPSDSPLTTLDWPEIEALSQSGLVDFGSHTHTHPILSRCSPEQQHGELRQSRDILRERLGRADLFAYPNGTRADFTGRTQQILKKLGYTCGVSTVPGLNRSRQDRYALRRVNIGADTSMRDFAWHMVGF
ncbi:MAG: polysaccharide deacetylase family protein [Gemmataceae bacterium]|nr:polysaccharide deacetylase family protein [Gemmataceae bacterium]